jgi:hypothetical protein
MAADTSGVVFVGQIEGSATIGTTSLTASDMEGNAFVAKLDTNGNVLWAKIASGATSLFEAVTIDATGSAIVTGAEYGVAPGTFTLDGTTLAPNNTSGMIGGNPVASSIGVLAKIDATGKTSWVKMVETTTEIDLGSVTLSGSNIVVAGPVNGDAAFGPGETMTVTGCPLGCVALAAFDATGTATWAKLAPSTPHRGNAGSNPHQVQVASDSAGNLFLGVGGYFEGVDSTDANQLIVNRYDATGAPTWNKSFMMPVGAEPDLSSFGVDAAGNAYILGEEADGLVIGTTTIGSDGGGNFLAKLSPAGDVTWVHSLDLIGAGSSAMAVGAQIMTFGNANDPTGLLSPDVTPMGLGRFDPGTASLLSSVMCGVAGGIGKAVTVKGTDVYVAGQGGPAGAFGTISTANAGVFVAKLK